MRRSLRAVLAALALTTAYGSAAASDPPGGVPLSVHACQRECLEGYMNKYLAAMAAHRVDPALFAPDVRFTENGVQLPFGTEGLWATASGVGHYKFYVPDVETQQVAFMGTMMEQASSSAAGAPRPPEAVGIDVRLRIDASGRISEVEQIVARPDRPLGGAAAAPGPFPATGAAVEAMGSPNPIFLAPVPEKERMSRADLIAVANQYFTGMQRNDGKGYYPFTDDCLRHENGIISAGPPGTPGGLSGRPLQTCKAQFENSLKGVVTSIRDRRYVAVDRERGIVFVFGAFDHRPINWTWEMGELFKIEKNQIRRIEAIFIRGPYGVCSGWSTYEQCRSEEIHDVR
jgi:hypothetical protein